MKTLYFDCAMGAAGDMLMGALFALCPDPDGFLAAFHGLNLPGIRLHPEYKDVMGQRGVHMEVTVFGEEEGHHNHHHSHSHAHSHHTIQDIYHILNHLPLSETVRENARAVYGLLAEAESHAHGCPVEQIHFHEVGTLDAVADVVGCCMLMEQLCPQEVLASPVNAGFGTVRCAHGILPVPAPATAWLLSAMPHRAGDTEGELCTPTGAALLRHFVTRFTENAPADAQKIGWGLGTKVFPGKVNGVRAELCGAQDQ